MNLRFSVEILILLSRKRLLNSVEILILFSRKQLINYVEILILFSIKRLLNSVEILILFSRKRLINSVEILIFFSRKRLINSVEILILFNRKRLISWKISLTHWLVIIRYKDLKGTFYQFLMGDGKLQIGHTIPSKKRPYLDVKGLCFLVSESLEPHHLGHLVTALHLVLRDILHETKPLYSLIYCSQILKIPLRKRLKTL